MKSYNFLIILFSFVLYSSVIAQDNEEIINYFQMEPLDDSLFVSMQQQVYIDPPDPKAEIIVDLRDANNATVSIKGTLYPYLAFSPDIRARIQVYPFKLNLAEQIHYGSVFTRVIEKVRVSKVFSPPSLHQISPSLGYINPFIQVFGGERFGASLKKDIGFSFGIGTPYSGPLETNFVEANLQIIGFSIGAFSVINELVEPKRINRYNNLYSGTGFQFSYTVPFGNFLNFSYMRPFAEMSDVQKSHYTNNSDSTYHVKMINGSYFNWEFRYPVSLFGSTRSKFYAARYLNEYHVGYTGRELSVAGSTFDFRIDAMPYSDIRKPQMVIDVLVQKLFDAWAFSSLAMGPSVIITEAPNKKVTISSVMLNVRFKLGTSL